MCRVSENALVILVSRRLLSCSKLVNYLGPLKIYSDGSFGRGTFSPMRR